MIELTGHVDKIIFRNEDTNYTILVLNSMEDENVVVGEFASIKEGEYISITGEKKLHPKYGEQLLVHSYKNEIPKSLYDVEVYLGSGLFKGLGKVLAKRIVNRFKEKTLEIIEKEPERLSEITGISENMAVNISEQYEENKENSLAMFFLQKYGLSVKLATRIYKFYRNRLYDVIKENPYQLLEDIERVGFKIADDIAKKVGIHKNSSFRIRAAFLHTLNEAAFAGHIYLPLEDAIKYTAELTDLDLSDVSENIFDLQIDKKIVLKKMSDFTAVYSSYFYYAELSIAKMLHDIDIRSNEDFAKVEKSVKKVQEEIGIKLDTRQEKAVIEAVYSGLLIITGGPGTGKTTVINSIIRYFEDKSMKVILAAPTGRAAKRMEEASLHEAKTIHRLLEVNAGIDDDLKEENYGSMFAKNENNKIEADVIIVDEVSMVDVNLMYSLLKAVSIGTRLILVGDINQLPSVGAGNVLRDIIKSEVFNVVVLKHIYRQSSRSDIVLNAHKIIDEDLINIRKKSEDFIYLERKENDKIINTILLLIKEKLPKYLACKMEEIQVLSPMKKGILGVENLNIILQNYLNPKNSRKKEKVLADTIFRVGDKVMQIKNNYQLEWTIRNEKGAVISSGTGIYNGDCGVILDIDEYLESVIVLFDDNKQVFYKFNMLNELSLSYAISVHKSQGSEYKAVIIPLFRGPRLLMTRNLIYTAITRARRMVILVGMEDNFLSMVSNTVELKRYSSLADRIEELDIIGDEE